LNISFNFDPNRCLVFSISRFSCHRSSAVLRGFSDLSPDSTSVLWTSVRCSIPRRGQVATLLPSEVTLSANFGKTMPCKKRARRSYFLSLLQEGQFHPRSVQACIPVSVKSSPSFQIVENRYGPACSIAISLAGYQDQEYPAANDSSNC
jgi:hypothetical protein